ncbi:MAG: UbiA family prenyltransferase [Bacteroidetes bacterium]|nr:UbiA family prenyltransferase [Bacteroidota bacterium]
MATSSALMATTSKDFSAFHFLFIFTGTFIGYYLANSNPEINFTNTKFKINESKIILKIAFILVLILLLKLSFPFFQLLQYGLASILSIIYYTQFTTKSGTFEGLRSVYLLKNFSIALAWALVTSPILLENSDSILLFLQRFLFLFALSISIDLRDIKKDSRRKIVTFPIQHGFRKTKGVAIILLLLSVALVYFYTCHQSSNSLLIASITSGILSILGILNLHEQSTNKQYLLLVDGNLLLHGILFFIFA